MTTNKYEQYNLLKHWRNHLSHGTFITKMLVESRQMKGNANTVCLDLWQCVHEKFSAWKTSTYKIIFKIGFSKPKVTAKMTIHVLVNDGKRFAFLVMLNAICYEANEIKENVLHKTDSASACLVRNTRTLYPPVRGAMYAWRRVSRGSLREGFQLVSGTGIVSDVALPDMGFVRQSDLNVQGNVL